MAQRKVKRLEELTTAEELELIQPPERRWNIGGREYVQRALGLEGTFDLLSEMIQGAQIALKHDILTAEDLNVDVKDRQQIMALLMKIVRSLPFVVARSLAIILGVKPTEKEMAHLDLHLGPALQLRIAAAFLDQNDVKDITDAFFELSAALRRLTGGAEADSSS